MPEPTKINVFIYLPEISFFKKNILFEFQTNKHASLDPRSFICIHCSILHFVGNEISIKLEAQTIILNGKKFR